jgi:glutamate-1-semialdehyde aminotransferase
MRIKIITKAVTNLSKLLNAQYEFLGNKDSSFVTLSKEMVQLAKDKKSLNFAMHPGAYRRAHTVVVTLSYNDDTNETINFNPSELIVSQ